MAVLAGKDGEVKLSSTKIGYIDNFSLSVEAEQPRHQSSETSGGSS